MKAILYVIDALRADHLSCYGYGRGTSPNIDNLAHDSVVFTNAHSQSTWTRASAGSILTGMYPPSSGLTTMFDSLPSGITTLPEYLSQEGVATLGVSAMGNVSSAFGFDAAFDDFIDLYKHPELRDRRQTIDSGKLFQRAGEDATVVNPTSGDLNEFVIPWIEEHGNEDFFVFIWSIDPHDPYDPLDEFREFSADQAGEEVPDHSDLSSANSPGEVGWIKDRYDDLIRQNDYYIGELCGALQDLGIYDELTFLLTGDHGEGFGEQNVYGHATTPVEGVIHVPLLLKLPNNDKCHRHSNALVGHIDIFPTFGRFSETQPPDTIQGEDLVSLMENNQTSRGLHSHTKMRESSLEYLSTISDDWKYISIREPSFNEIISFTARPGRIKLMLHKILKRIQIPERERLYPIGEHIDESKNMAQEHKLIKQSLAEQLDEWLHTCGGLNNRLQAQRADIDDRTEDQLKQMGYLE